MKGMIQNPKSRKGAAAEKNRLALYEAFLAIKNRAECAAFLRDLCTVAELDSMAERFAIARLISKDVSYRDTADEVGASTGTVTRVAHWLHHGRGGYPLIISRLKK